jgi:hypothetical protein
MAETKYGKYIIDRPVKKLEPPGMTEEEIKAKKEFFTVPLYVDSEVAPGAYYFMAAWWHKITGKGSPAEEHDHEFDEYLIFLGTNPEDPTDLGGEVELYIEGEKHILTRSCSVFIPAGLKHAPIYFKRIDRPIWYLATGPTKIYKKEIVEDVNIRGV